MNHLLLWLLENSLATALLAVVVLAAGRGLRNRPALAHALWLIVLVKFLTPPLISWPWPIEGFAQVFAEPPSEDGRRQERAALGDNFSEPPTPHGGGQLPNVETSRQETATLNALADRIRELPPPGDDALKRNDSDSADPPVPGASGARDAPLATELLDPSPGATAEVASPDEAWVGRWLLGCWIAGGMVVVLCQVRGIARCRALMRRSDRAGDALNNEVQRLARLIGISPIPARVSRETASPFVWCCPRPRLLWPEQLAGIEDVTRLRAVIAHELAHVRRRDHLVAWLVMLACVAWWWNPVFWLVRRRLHDASESACDAIALRIVPDDRRAYARTLLELSSNFSFATPAPLLGVSAGARHSFHRRLTMILSDRVSDRLSRGSLLAVALLVLVAAPSWSLGQADSEAPAAQSPPPATPPAALPPAPIVPQDSATRNAVEPPAGASAAPPPPVSAPQPTPPAAYPPGSAQPRNLEDRLERVERALDRILDRLEQGQQQPDKYAPAQSSKSGGTQPNELPPVPKPAPAFGPSTVARPKLPPRGYDDPLQDETTPKKAPAATAQNTPARPSGQFNPFGMHATSVPATSAARAEQLDLVSLGTSYIEANGAVRLAEAHYKRLQAEGDAISRGELDAAQIELETARQKLALLGTIARIALEAAKAEFAAAKVTLERSTVLRDQGVVTHDETAQAEAAVAAARARLQVLESILGASGASKETGGGADTGSLTPPPVDDPLTPTETGATPPAPKGAFSEFRLGELVVALDSRGPFVVANDATSGKTVWKLSLEGEEVESINVTDNRLMIATSSGRVLMVDGKTGRIERTNSRR